MRERRDAGPGWIMGGGTAVLIVIPIPLYREFFEPGRTVWNIFLVLILAALVIAAVFLQFYLVTHAGEIGEARFDTSGKRDADG